MSSSQWYVRIKISVFDSPEKNRVKTDLSIIMFVYILICVCRLNIIVFVWLYLDFLQVSILHWVCNINLLCMYVRLVLNNSHKQRLLESMYKVIEYTTLSLEESLILKGSITFSSFWALCQVDLFPTNFAIYLKKSDIFYLFCSRGIFLINLVSLTLNNIHIWNTYKCNLKFVIACNGWSFIKG